MHYRKEAVQNECRKKQETECELLPFLSVEGAASKVRSGFSVSRDIGTICRHLGYETRQGRTPQTNPIAPSNALAAKIHQSEENARGYIASFA